MTITSSVNVGVGSVIPEMVSNSSTTTAASSPPMVASTDSTLSFLANTPKPPYYCVIFSSVMRGPTEENPTVMDTYASTAAEMDALAAQQPGLLGHEALRDPSDLRGIFVSYWDSLESIKMWKRNVDHLVAQRMGRDQFYKVYSVRIAKVEREYRWMDPDVAQALRTASESPDCMGVESVS
ncbi:hypothetical protein HDU86_007866 [Geranomyces michiganensis]|nr:hypothetical protein HDU86_007866 [Geranomyces michiganensis]